MIDLHFHCLPGIDDGPATWDDAVALCRAAASDGAETIIATPHVLRDRWLNEDASHRAALVAELNRRLDRSPVIEVGCEYFFSADAIDLWQQGEAGPLTGLNSSTYLLVEFSALRVPHHAEAVFHELSLIGVHPIIAHPERNMVFVEQPERLDRLVQLGAFTQITAGSIIGAFGKAAQNACAAFFRRGLIHFVASDAHSVNRRPPVMSAARERVKEQWGVEAEAGLFDANPAAVIAGDMIPWTC